MKRIAGIAAGLLFLLGGVATAQTPGPKAAPATTQATFPVSFSLWRPTVTGVFALPSRVWLDEKSIVRKAGKVDFWLLQVEPYSDMPTPAGNVAAWWNRIEGDCTGAKLRPVKVIGVNMMNYFVLERPLASGQPLAAPPKDDEGFSLALTRACNAVPADDPAPRATIFAQAIIWTRNNADWEKDKAKATAKPK